MQMTLENSKEQLLIAGYNIKNKFYNNIKQLNLINKDAKQYLFTLFN